MEVHQGIPKFLYGSRHQQGDADLFHMALENQRGRSIRMIVQGK